MSSLGRPTLGVGMGVGASGILSGRRTRPSKCFKTITYGTWVACGALCRFIWSRLKAACSRSRVGSRQLSSSPENHLGCERPCAPHPLLQVAARARVDRRRRPARRRARSQSWWRASHHLSAVRALPVSPVALSIAARSGLLRLWILDGISCVTWPGPQRAL